MNSITTDDGVVVSSSHESPEDMRLAFGVEQPDLPEVGDAPVEEPEPAPEPDPEPEPELVAKPAKVDKRTLEGKRKSLQAEIDAATARRHAAKAEADAEEQRLAALRAQRAAVEAPPRSESAAATFPFSEAEPTIEQFKDQADPYTAWMRACARWEGRKEFAQQQATSRQQAQQQFEQNRIAQRKQTYQTNIQPRIASDPEFVKRVAAVPALTVHASFELPPGTQPTVYNDLVEEIMLSAVPDKIIEHYLDNPTDLQRLATLNSRGELARAIGKIEARVEAALSGPARTSVSHAKAPIKPVGTSPDVSVDETDDPEDLSEAAILRHHKRENARDPRFGRTAARR